MAKTKIYIDPVGNTMNIWWSNPSNAASSEEVDDPTRNDIIIKDKNGQPIGIEILGVFPSELNISKISKKIGLHTDTPFELGK